MKTGFIHAFMKNMIGKKDYMPLTDEEGRMSISNTLSILTKKTFGDEIIIELLDGDHFTDEEIAARLTHNCETLAGLKSGSAYFFEIFIFDATPGKEKQDAIVTNQFQNVMAKKYIKCFSVDLSNRSISKHFTVPVFDCGISREVGRIFESGFPEETDPALINEINDLVMQKSKDYKMEFKVKVPVLTYTLIAINIAVAVFIRIYSLKSGVSYDELLLTFGAKLNYNIIKGEYWRFITPVFLHANEIHLLVNCYSLYVIGMSTEKLFGRFRFFIVYFVAGILGNILSFMFSTNPGVGASGAIFGLLGTLLYFGLERPSLFRVYFGRSIFITIFINLAYGFSRTGIDNFAHIGGLIGGFLASGIVSKTEKRQWYFNRYLYLVVTAAVAFSGIAYGFGSKRNKVLVEINELAEYDEAQDWANTEAKAEEVLPLLEDKDLTSSVLLTLIKAEALSSKYDEAVEHCRSLILLNPADGHYMMGILHYDMQQYALSRDELQEAKKEGASYEQIDQILSDIDKLLSSGK
ncbi:MAG: rhomboid family intramembrane serine protease [Clostridiaceae bacterium]